MFIKVNTELYGYTVINTDQITKILKFSDRKGTVYRLKFSDHDTDISIKQENARDLLQAIGVTDF